MKKSYKQLKKKLLNRFLSGTSREYSVDASVGQWVAQCKIPVNHKHTEIICTIYGSVMYPYQEKDRVIVLEYLKNNKFKDFKHDYPTIK